MTLAAFGASNPIFGNAAGLDTDSGHHISLMGRTIGWILARNNMPVILVPNGTVTAGGAITLGTALTFTYGPCWIYLPAGAISGGVAGLYYCVMTSTTVGQVYTAYQAATTTGLLEFAVPSILTAAIGTGAYVQTTGANIPLMSARVPAGLIDGRTGLLCDSSYTVFNSANNKILTTRINGTALSFVTLTASLQCRNSVEMFTRPGNLTTLFGSNPLSLPYGASAAGLPNLTMDMTVDQTVQFTGQIATATEWVVLETGVMVVR